LSSPQSPAPSLRAPPVKGCKTPIQSCIRRFRRFNR
jgi:hypothetical protein